jgi:hypothetical protein
LGWISPLLYHSIFSRGSSLLHFLNNPAITTMHSFLFPEDLNGPPAQPSQRLFASRKSKPAPRITTALPKMPSRAPPTIPQHDHPAPPPPAHAPPPIPSTKEKAIVSVTELSIPDRQPEPELRRTKSKWSQRQIPGISGLRDRREAKAVAREAEATAAFDVFLPPLSPIVDEEFWRTGKYPSSTDGFAMVHVPF